MTTYKILSVLAFMVTLIWSVMKPGYDSVAAAVASFAALVGVFIAGDRKRDDKQVQEVGAGGIGIQAGRDAQIGSIDQRK